MLTIFAVDRNGLVAYQLPGFGARRCKAHAVNRVVEAAFQQAQQVLTRRSLLLLRQLSCSSRGTAVPARRTCGAASAFRAAANRSPTKAAATAACGLPRRILQFALGVQRFDAALQKQVCALATREFAFWSQIPGHQSVLKRGAFSAGGNRCAESGSRLRYSKSESPQAFSERTADSRPGPGPCTRTSRFFMPIFLCGTAGLLGRDLRGKRRALTRAAKSATTGRCPGHCIALTIRDRDDRVVKRSMDVRDPFGNHCFFTFLRFSAEPYFDHVPVSA